MAHSENIQGITKIQFEIFTGNTYPSNLKPYTNQFRVVFIPWNRIPNYEELETTIKEKIDKQSLTIEDAVKTMFDIINEYRPKSIKVVSIVEDATHFPVVVELKEGNFNDLAN
jgi:hypothetical protein